MSRPNYHKCGIAEHFPIITKREESISHSYIDPGPSSSPSVKINISPVGSVYINFQFVFSPRKLLIVAIRQAGREVFGAVRGNTYKFEEGFCNCACFYVAGTSRATPDT
jgi:hypothetical protein